MLFSQALIWWMLFWWMLFWWMLFWWMLFWWMLFWWMLFWWMLFWWMLFWWMLFWWMLFGWMLFWWMLFWWMLFWWMLFWWMLFWLMLFLLRLFWWMLRRRTTYHQLSATYRTKSWTQFFILIISRFSCQALLINKKNLASTTKFLKKFFVGVPTSNFWNYITSLKWTKYIISLFVIEPGPRIHYAASSSKDIWDIQKLRSSQ